MKDRKQFFHNRFYPGDPAVLAKQINTLLAGALLKFPLSKPRIIIVPHAGYDFSGSVAAWGYKQIVGQKINTVYLLGVSHQAYFNGLSVWNGGFWHTPLGKVPTSISFVKKAKQADILLEEKDRHLSEHCLEVQLPFLQSVLKKFSIVPLLLSFPSDDLLAGLSRLLSKKLDDKSLLVISADFSHYPSYDVAKMVDSKTVDAVLSNSVKQFAKVTQELESRLVPGLETACCSKAAVKTGLMVSQKMSLKPFLFSYQNSGDAGSHDHSRVVGYAAIGFYE